MQLQTITHVMIAGSRSATHEMLDCAWSTVRRAYQLGWIILVGDNTKGFSLAPTEFSDT